MYDYVESAPKIILPTCMAHIQRKFIEAQKRHPVQVAKALEYIATLFICWKRTSEAGELLSRKSVSKGLKRHFRLLMPCRHGWKTFSTNIHRTTYLVKRWNMSANYGQKSEDTLKMVGILLTTIRWSMGKDQLS